MLERDYARDDRPLMNGAADAVSELQAKGAHFVGKAELLGLGPHTRYLVGRHARLDALDGPVEPVARLLVGVVLYRRGAADVEGAIVAGPVTHERLQDVKKGLVTGAQHAVGEIVRVRIAALARDGIDRLHVVGAVPVQKFVDLGDDIVFADAGL